MKTITSFCFLFLVVRGLLSAAAEYKHVEREPTALEKETFTLLKKKFPDEVLDEKLETLRELSDSSEYVNFLSERYPNLGPFTAFEDFFFTVLPPKEYYFKFFKEQFDIQTIEEIFDDELFLTHAYMSEFWTLEAYRRGADKSPCIERLGVRLLAITPKGRKMLERRLGIERKADLTIVNWALINLSFRPLIYLSKALLDEDVRWIKTLFEKHGQSDGLLWLAVGDPILFDRILHAFSTNDTFLKCLYDPVDTYREYFLKRQGQKQKERE